MNSSPAQMAKAAKVRWDVICGKPSKIIERPNQQQEAVHGR